MKNSIWTVVSIAVVLSLSVVGIYFYGVNRANSDKIAHLTESKNILEENIAKISEEKKSVEDKLVSLSAENAEALARISEYSSKLETMTSEHRIITDGLRAERDKLMAEIDALNRELSEKNSEARFLKKSLKRTGKAISGVKGKGAASAVSLEPIVVSKQKNLSGKILEVHKDYGFVIIDLGSDDGVSVSDTLFVYRKNVMLGKVVVEEVAGKYCAAKILVKTLADAVKKGDVVTK